MILIFDLDDTLYPETTYVHSGLKAVAAWGEENIGAHRKSSFAFMKSVLESEGRGLVFDRWLKEHDRFSKANVRACVKCYRHHTPDIKLPDMSRALLERLENRYPLYLVTDGHKMVQDAKVRALGVRQYLRRAFITHRFGVRHAKPSLYCFDLIRRAENVGWDDLCYIGDNPAKDFVNLNTKGARTVRVMTGMFSTITATEGYDARYRISDLSGLEEFLARF